MSMKEQCTQQREASKASKGENEGKGGFEGFEGENEVKNSMNTFELSLDCNASNNQMFNLSKTSTRTQGSC